MRVEGETAAQAVERWFARWPAQIAFYLAFSLLTRFAMLGDPGYHDDDSLFWLIGQRMHEGMWPYVDLWDRKGPGLFTLFYLFAGISDSILSYQIGALVFAALTAFVVNRIAYHYTGRVGAMMAGTLYLAELPLFMGGGAQAAVFFNLPIALSALLVLTRDHGSMTSRSSVLAMLLAGVAATFKQTCLFDGVFLGLVLLWQHHRAGAKPGGVMSAGLQYALAGALPMLVYFAIYAAAGYFPQLWHALVDSNLDKQYAPFGDHWERIGILLMFIAPALPLVAVGLLRPLPYAGKQAPRLLLTLWLLVVLSALVAIPNFIEHYMIPVILVLSICAAPAMQRMPAGLLYGYAAIFITVLFGPSFDFAARAQSKAEFRYLLEDIHASGLAPRLFIYEGPTALYQESGLELPPTPLIFPFHLYHGPERDTSYLETAGEVQRILDWHPTVVITRHEPPRGVNEETNAMVQTYVHAHCRLWYTREIPDRYPARMFDIWGDCAP